MIPEPTSLDLVPAAAGSLTFRLHVTGLACHASRRTSGVSALEKFWSVFAALRQLETRRNVAVDPLMARWDVAYPIEIGVVRAGDWSSSVPDSLIAEGRYGIALGEVPEEAELVFEQAVRAACDADPWLRRHPVEVEWWGGQFASGMTDVNSPIVTSLAEAHASVSDRIQRVWGAPFGSDLRLTTAARGDAHRPLRTRGREPCPRTAGTCPDRGSADGRPRACPPRDRLLLGLSMTEGADLMAAGPLPSWERIGPTDPVVVIGAGMMGCAAAYHLLRAGARNVTLLDANTPGGGTTAAGAGFVALWAAGRVHPVEPCLSLERYGLHFYGGLNSAGYRIGYRNNGNLVLALTEQTWLRSVVKVAEHAEASPGTRVLDGRETTEMTAVVNPEAVHAAVLMPSGIQIEAGLAVKAVASLVSQMGGAVDSGTTVTGFSTRGRNVTAVETSHGRVKARGVIVAAGAWTNPVLSHLGLHLPLLRVVASRLLTEPLDVPATMPTIQCDDFGMWIRESEGGFTWGSFSAYRPAHLLEQPGSVLGPGQPRSEALMELQRAEQTRLAPIFPRLSDAPVASWRQGMPVYTPDGQPIVGRLPTYDNVVVLGGDNESGIGHGPAMGRVAAEILRGEEPFVDVDSCRPDRFEADVFPDEESVERHLASGGTSFGPSPASDLR